jgi:hypothetical protein
MLGAAAHESLPGDGAAGFRRLGTAVFVAGAIAAIGDVVTTWWLVRVVPGGYEANGGMAALMHAIGLTPALVLRGAVGLGYAWVVGGIVSGRHRLARTMVATRAVGALRIRERRGADGRWTQPRGRAQRPARAQLLRDLNQVVI